MIISLVFGGQKLETPCPILVFYCCWKKESVDFLILMLQFDHIIKVITLLDLSFSTPRGSYICLWVQWCENRYIWCFSRRLATGRFFFFRNSAATPLPRPTPAFASELCIFASTQIWTHFHSISFLYTIWFTPNNSTIIQLSSHHFFLSYIFIYCYRFPLSCYNHNAVLHYSTHYSTHSSKITFMNDKSRFLQQINIFQYCSSILL